MFPTVNFGNDTTFPHVHDGVDQVVNALSCLPDDLCSIAFRGIEPSDLKGKENVLDTIRVWDDVNKVGILGWK